MTDKQKDLAQAVLEVIRIPEYNPLLIHCLGLFGGWPIAYFMLRETVEKQNLIGIILISMSTRLIYLPMFY